MERLEKKALMVNLCLRNNVIFYYLEELMEIGGIYSKLVKAQEINQLEEEYG
jgi:hypothetical protein